MTQALRPILLLAVLLIIISGQAFAAPIGLTVNGGNLVAVDLENGASDRIGPLGFEPSIVALDNAPDGTLFGLEDFTPTVQRLVQIQRSTGEATVIGDVGSGDASGLAFDGSGRLFVADGPTLFQVDPTTAAASPVLDMGTAARALTASDGDLYAVRFGPVSGCELVLLEPDLGTVTQIAPNIPCARSADGRDGTLWLVDYFSPIMGVLIVVSYRLDLLTGVVEEIGGWSGLYGGELVVPGGLAEVGSRSLQPTVDVPALGDAGLVLFALTLAIAALVFARRRLA